MNIPNIDVDGNWIDVWSIVGAFAYGAVKHCIAFLRKQPHYKDGKKFALNVVNGLALFPVLVLTLGSVSNPLLRQLLDASRITLFIAGIVAFFAILTAE